VPGHIYLAFNLGVLYAQWADSAYELTVTAGTGVAFADSNAASTTVTLDNGNATVLASFVDSQAPAKPVIQVVSDGTVTNQDVVFSITNIETGATVEYTTNNGGDWLSYTIGSDVTIPKGIDTVDTYEIAARQTDGAGNTSPVDPGDYIGVTIDTTAPGAPSVSGDPSPSSEPRPEWTWSSGSGDGNGTFKYKLDSGSYTITVEYYTVYYDGRGHDGGTLPDDSHYGPGDLVTVQSGSSLYHDGLFISELRRRYFVYGILSLTDSVQRISPGEACRCRLFIPA
jgi:hypothetical protein